jgi:NAD-specific glutamate dehydrogenase
MLTRKRRVFAASSDRKAASPFYTGEENTPARSKRKIITRRNTMATEEVVFEGMGFVFMICFEFRLGYTKVARNCIVHTL